MSDSTAIILIDTTASDVENMQATVANSLVGDFAASMGPIASKCDTLAYKTNGIKDKISGMKSTNPSLLDQLIANALNAAFQSSAWAMGADAISGIQGMLDKCDYFKDAANKAGKYVDANKFINSLAAAAAEKAEQAIDAIKEQFKGQGDFPELGIGKTLSDIVSTGRAVYDKVEETLEDIGDALSPIIEQGKSAINVMQTELAAAAKELGKLDKLVDCLTAIGGPDYAPTIDGMINELDCYYEKLGVFSDPNFANFGEFDIDNYLDTIGTLSPEGAASIKKSVNLYSKARKNAEGAMAKVGGLGIKTPSALFPAKSADTITRKEQHAKENSKTSYEVPGIPGKTESKTVTMPTPDPITPAILSAGDPPDPKPGEVAYANFIKSTNFEVQDDLYYDFDPGEALKGEFLSSAYALINKSVEDPEQSEHVELEISIISLQFVGKNKYAPGQEDVPDSGKRVIYTLYCLAAVRVSLENLSTHKHSMKSDIGQATTNKWYSKSEVLSGLPSDVARTDIMKQSINNAIKKLSFSVSELENTIGGFF